MTRKQKKMVARIAASAVLLVAAVLIPYEGPWRFVLFLPAYFVIGWDVLWIDWENMIAKYMIQCRVLYFEKER